MTIQGTVFDGKSTVTGASILLGADTISPWYVKDKSAVTDLDGRFTFKHIGVPDPDRPDWSYVINADIKDELDLPSYRFSIFRGEGTRSLELNTQDPRAVSNGRGRLVTLTDFPPSAAHGVEANAAVLHGTVEAPDAVTSSTKIQVTLLGDSNIEAMAWVTDGTFKIEGVPAGTYTVLCSTRGGIESTRAAVYEPIRVKLEDGRLSAVHLVPGTATLSGNVTNLAPNINYHLLLRSLDPHSLWIRHKVASTKFDRNGGFKISGVPAGNYQLSIEGKASHYAEAIVLRPGEHITRQIRMPDGIPVSGRVLDVSTGEPVESARLQFHTAIDRGAIDRGPTTVKAGPDGVYYATLTSGTYHVFASAVGQGWMQRIEVQVKDTPTSLPDILINSSSGGILAHNRGDDKNIAMRELSFDLVGKSAEGTPAIAVSSNLRWAVDQDTAMLREVKPGRYGLLMRSYEYSETDDAVATVYIPDVEVRPDVFTEIDVALERAPWVKLVCYPGRHSVSWNNPNFWIRDSAGVQIPIKLSDSFTLPIGLAPGKYEFGITLDSGETQAVKFEVTDQDQEVSAILQLQD